MRGLVPTLILGFALLWLFLTQRAFDTTDFHAVAVWIGVALVVGAVAGRAWEWRRAVDPARKVETWLLAGTAGVALSLGLYALSTEWGLELLGIDPEESRFGAVLAVLWPALLAASGAAVLFMELAYRRMPVPEAVELRRVRHAALNGLSLALSLVFVVSINYVAQGREVRKDLTYFKTTEPSDDTLEMVSRVSEPVEVVLFYPSVNDVLDQLEPYFDRVEAASDTISVRVADHALVPALARQHRIEGNGWVALTKGEGESQQAETFQVGTELEEARTRLENLDGSFQESFLRLVRQERKIALTAGHDERSQAGAEMDDETKRLRDFHTLLERNNFETETLSVASGLANEVPEGTPAVFVIGPRKPLLDEEIEALTRYLKKGGRVLVMADPDEDHGLSPLLRRLGLEMLEGTLTSDRDYLVRTRTKADRAIVRTQRFTSHPTVTLASRNAGRVAAVTIDGGALERYEGDGVLDGAQVIFPIRTSADVWRDMDGDYEKDADEASGAMNVMAAVTVPNEGEGEEGRAVVIADGDFITDLILRNPGNALVLQDTVQWMIGEEQIVAQASSEEDVQFEQTGTWSKAFFYGTSFAVPLPLLLIGFFVATRRGRRAARGRDPGEAGPGAKGPGSNNPGSKGPGSKGPGSKGPGEKGAGTSAGAPEEVSS